MSITLTGARLMPPAGSAFAALVGRLAVMGLPVVETASASLRATSGEQAVEQVVDLEKNIGDTFARVLPGKKTTWKVAFPKEEGDFLVTVDWNFQEPVTFQ